MMASIDIFSKIQELAISKEVKENFCFLLSIPEGYTKESVIEFLKTQVCTEDLRVKCLNFPGKVLIKLPDGSSTVVILTSSLNYGVCRNNFYKNAKKYNAIDITAL